jgi:hypothetical protein
MTRKKTRRRTGGPGYRLVKEAAKEAALHYCSGRTSGARGLGSGLASDSSIWARRLAAFSTKAAASLGSFVDCANSRAVAA